MRAVSGCVSICSYLSNKLQVERLTSLKKSSRGEPGVKVTGAAQRRDGGLFPAE